MKIKMITLYAGPQGVMNPSKTYSVNDALGRLLVAGHYAVEVKVAPAVEAADLVTDEVETSVPPEGEQLHPPRRGRRAAKPEGEETP